MSHWRSSHCLLRVSIAACLFAGSLAWAKDKESPTCQLLKDHARVGDLVFIEIPSELFQKVARASGGWTSHVGIVAADPRGELQIYESTLPKSKVTEFCAFLKRSSQERFVLKRPNRSLSPSDQIRIGFEARKRLGIDYDLGFNFHSKKQFCSKYVAQIYHQIWGEWIGEFESFDELMSRLKGHPKEQEDLLFWRLYFLGRIPRERITLSPESQFVDERFYVVTEHHPLE